MGDELGQGENVTGEPDCFVCGDNHCNGEDGGGAIGPDDPNGCYCPGCTFCREEYDLHEWWARELSEKR